MSTTTTPRDRRGRPGHLGPCPRDAPAPDPRRGDRRAHDLDHLAGQVFAAHPDLEQEEQATGQYAPKPRDRLRAGVGASAMAFPALGYAAAAQASYTRFAALKAAGTIPEHVRFQGAGQAIEDAAVLAACMAGVGRRRRRAGPLRGHAPGASFARPAPEPRAPGPQPPPDGEEQRRRDAELARSDPVERDAWMYGLYAELAFAATTS